MTKQTIRTLILTLLFAAATANTYAQTKDEKQIRALVKKWTVAFQAKDVDGVMALYHRSPKLVAFDVVPPLQYVGWDAYQKNYEEFFAMFEGPLRAEVSDFTLAISGDLAYSHNTERVTGTMKSGEQVEVVLRVTDIYRKVQGKWVVVHEHVSVPADFATGKAVFNASK